MYNPGSNRYPVYQISNPLDLSTLYYVQVVIQYANGLGQISKLNLVSKGNGLYAGVGYQIPQSDASGLNSNFSIFETVSVYTDSAYTQLSPNYSIVNTPIDIGFIPTNASSLNGGGGSFDLTDYPFIRKLIKEELVEFLELMPKQKDFKFDTKNLEELIGEVSRQFIEHSGFVANEFKGHREVLMREFEGMNNNVLGINKAIGQLPLQKIMDQIISHIENFTGLVSELHKKHDSLDFDGIKNSYDKSLADLRNQLTEALTGNSKEVRDTMMDFFNSVDAIQVTKGIPRPEYREPEKIKPDYLSLASSFIRKTKKS